MITFPLRRRIYLMRHGEAAYVSENGEMTDNPRQVNLTEQGRQQAQSQGEVLQGISFDKAICSGLPRTIQTAQHVLAACGHSHLALEEKPNMEEIHGLGSNRVWPEDPDALKQVLLEIANPWALGVDPSAQFLGGELFSDFRTRISRGWHEIIEDQEWHTLLLVLHGAVNREIINIVSGLNWDANFVVEQDNCCINIIDVDDTTPPRYLLRAVNLTNYNLNKSGIERTNMEDTAVNIARQLGFSGST